MNNVSKDAVHSLYVGLSIGVGIIGFVVLSLLTHWIMPEFKFLGDFMGFLWVCGWIAVWVIYTTLYSFGAYLLWFPVKRAVLKEVR